MHPSNRNRKLIEKTHTHLQKSVKQLQTREDEKERKVSLTNAIDQNVPNSRNVY